MKKFKETVDDFLNELSRFGGNPPQFSINYERGELKIHYAPSAFITQLARDERWSLSLTDGSISVNRFAD